MTYRICPIQVKVWFPTYVNPRMSRDYHW